MAAILLAVSISANAQTLLFEDDYYSNGKGTSSQTGMTMTLSDAGWAHIKVYSNKLVAESGGKSFSFPLIRKDAKVNRYKKDNVEYMVVLSTHSISLLVNDHILVTLKAKHPINNNTIVITPQQPYNGGGSTNTPAQAPICRKCNGAGHYYYKGEYRICGQCGGLGRDWNS